MADKIPVQDELSKRLAELIWCFAGTEEEDEYAGQVYLDMDEGERADFGSDGTAPGMEDEHVCDDDCEHENEDQEDDNDEDLEEDEEDDDDDDSYEVHMEEIENTLDSSDEDEEGENKEDDEEANEIDDALQKHCRGAHLASLFVRTFFRTMRREWGNVDKHRVDKFYTAMRLVLAEVYKYMAKRHWNLGIIRLFNDTLFEEVLSQVPNGLRYHLIDITIAELAKANREADLPLTEATFLDCLEPYFALAQSAEDKIAQKRIVDNVLTKFLMEHSVVSDNAVEADESDETGELIFQEVHVGSVAKFIFEMASDGETKDRYRAGLYELHKTYQRRIASIGRDVDLEDDSDEQEVEDGGVFMAEEEEEEEEEVEESPEPPKSKSKKKKKDKLTEETSTSKSSSSKKVKSKGKESNKDIGAEDEENNEVDEHITSQVVDPADFITPTKKTKKEKKSSKKKKSKAEAEETSVGSDEDEDVVNISVKEQKKAAKASAKKSKATSEKKTKKKERKMSIEEQEEEERRKSVSFGAVNHSKSYKASMKDLKRRDLPSTAVMTPDKSILHKRNVQSADGKSKKKDGKGKRVRGGAPATEPRKRRAVDYF